MTFDTDTAVAAPERQDPVNDRPLERLTAMEAVVRLLVEQAELDRRRGLRTGGFATGYPGSPVGGLQSLLERNAGRLEKAGVHQSPGLNEELAATAVWGAQTVPTLPDAKVDGVFGLWYGKAPGVDRAADALRHGNIRGAHPHGGVLVLAGDDPNANATNYPSDSTFLFQAFAMPVLYPGTVQEILDLGHHGYALSRAAGLWVGFKMVTAIADGSGTVDTDPARLTFREPTVSIGGKPFHPVLRANDPGPPMREAEKDMLGGRRQLAEQYIDINDLNPIVVEGTDARIGVVAPGKTYYDLRRALTNLGLDDDTLATAPLRIKKVSALYPIGRAEWLRFTDGLDRIIVIEEKRPLLELALKDTLYGRPDAPAVLGKTDTDGTELFPGYGEFGPDLITRVLGGQLAKHGVVKAPAARPTLNGLLPVLPLETARAPFFCSGCPHNVSLRAPEGAVVGAGIGCHIMSLLVNREEYGNQTGFTQMGGEGAQWVGQAPFTGVRHILQNIGDGTYHHSGSLALRLATASEVNITYKILYNSAVGMTGGQAVKGSMGVPALTHSLRAEGVRKIIVTTDEPRRHRRRDLAPGTEVWHRDRLIEAQEKLATISGVTVLIHDQECAAERRRRWSRGELPKPTQRIMVSERVCEGCGDCNAKSQCLSVQPVETEYGRKTKIHQSSCNLDFTCAKGDCPSFLTVDVKKAKKAKRTSPEPPDVPSPTVLVPRDGFTAHMTGIGGTGVVSANAILARAAASDGFEVRSLDLPGPSIKAGRVVSQIQVYAHGSPQPAAVVGPGEADLFLGFDMLGAMAPGLLDPLGVDRTVVVASSSLEPTGDMAVDPSIPLPPKELLIDRLRSLSRPDAGAFIDVAATCDAVFGHQRSANALLIGAAYQAGALPFTEKSLLRAFRDSGVAVEDNLKAFGWGRVAVARPALIADLGLAPRPTGGGVEDPALTPMLTPFTDEQALRDLVLGRAEDLRGYQNLAYAQRYLSLVAEVFQAERSSNGPGPTTITPRYARGLYKLMAYKDEYEVARLLLLDSARQAVTAEFGTGAKVSWNLHPPFLRALGMKRKLKLGPWFTPAFVLLRSMRGLRGTPLDPFGPAKVRRIERALVEEYVEMMGLAMSSLSEHNTAGVQELADAPDLVRGYEFVKVRHLTDYFRSVERVAAEAGIAYSVPVGLRELATKAAAPTSKAGSPDE
ncbi:indolepyruvate ferredoxin oxidoreductase family protein [Streptomyces sp. NPDC020766]|uniref:indolepyruvate ferredoxin oxidoreductase family protein n=1 Tax=Streptomyces sp. NPDC020766 TaxID=3155011 RepID=UPI0033C718F2